MVAHHPHGLFDKREVAGFCAERRILEADANMAAAPDRLPDQGTDTALTPAIIQGAPGASSSSSAK